MGLIEITKNISYLPASENPLSSDVVFITKENKTYIFDVGADDEVAELINGITNEKIVVISHFHQDHAANVGRIKFDELYASKETIKHTHTGSVISDKIGFDDITALTVPSSHAKGCVIVVCGDFSLPYLWHSLWCLCRVYGIRKKDWIGGIKMKKKMEIGKKIAIGLSIILTVCWLIPYIYVICCSFKPGAEVIAVPPKFFPRQLSIENFIGLFERTDVVGFLVNSLITAICSTIIALILGSLAAYAIQRSGAKLSIFLVVLVLCLKMIPTSSIAVPIYELICKLGLYDTKIALIIVYAAINMPFVMWTMLSFYEGIPITLDEAACVDGATNIQTFQPLPQRPNYNMAQQGVNFNPDWPIRVNVEHILGDTENIERLPAKIRKARNLPLLFETAVELARRKAVVEPGIISAQGYQGRIQYLLPIYLTNMNKPDLAMTLTVMDGYYLGNTCLTLEMAYLNARVLARPVAPWLRDLVK